MSRHPYQQGSLDGLCGLYAVINSIQCIVEHERKVMSIVRDELPGILVREITRRRRFEDAFLYGIGTPEVAHLLECAAIFLKRKWVSIALSRPLLSVRKPTIAQSIALLRRELEQGNCALVLGLGGHHDHWSVGRRITSKFIAKYDSVGIGRVSIDHCRMAYEPKLKSVEHVVGRASIFRVSVDWD